MTMATMTLEDRITAILKENTGAHFLDSGGAYGRHWERNQTRDFKKEPACFVEAEVWQDQPTLSIYYNLWHYLVNFLEYDEVCEELNQKFMDFCNLPEYKEETWETCEEAWCKTQPFKILGSAYTYNFDTLLDQDIAYVEFEYEDESYIFLRVHGGCDARGGFTKPVIFKLPESDYFYLAQTDCYLYARLKIDERQQKLAGMPEPKTEYCWDSDDCGYHWYGQDKEPKLEEVLRVIDNKPYVQIGDQLLELHASVTGGY